LVRDYRIKKAIKSLNILKKKSAKVKSCYNKVVKSVITLFKQLVYYNYNKVEFREFKHIREKANKINWYVFLALNKQRKRFKSSLILLFKGFITFVFITVIYKGFSISAKFRPESVARETLVKAVFSKVASFS
jgi:hypothetical protein